MWQNKLILATLMISQTWAKSQVLVTNRGEPAPFPHFPQTEVEAAASAEAFQFAPTPSGRAPVPTPAAALVAQPQPPLVEPQQALGKLIILNVCPSVRWFQYRIFSFLRFQGIVRYF